MLIPVEELKDDLIRLLGEPDDSNKLNEYLDFVYSNECLDDSIHSEYHHIIPQCLEKTNATVRLSYNDHCHAHLLLFLAFNQNKLHRTLNFMKPTIDDILSADYKKARSESAKRGWISFRADTDRYQEVMKNKSITQSKIMKEWLSEYLLKIRWDDPKQRKMMSDKFKNLWADDEYRKQIIESMKIERNTDEARQRASNCTQRRWDDMDAVDRELFREKMDLINKDEDKRIDAGIKIKKKWEDPSFRNKMLNRPKRSEEKNKEHSSKIKELWADPVWKANMLKKRKLAKEKRNEAK